MPYYLAYNTSTSLLVGLSDKDIEPQEGITIEFHSEDMPDLSKVFWNSSIMQWNNKYINVLSKKDFIKRLTATEYATIKAAAAQSAELDYYWQLFMQAQEIVLDDIDTTRGVWMLELFGLIGPGRATEILS